MTGNNSAAASGTLAKLICAERGVMMSHWQSEYDSAADREAAHFARASDQELLKAIRRRKFGDYHVIWREIATRTATAETCWILYDVLLSDRAYLDRYHCAAALLDLLQCTQFQAVELSAAWPIVANNLSAVHGIIAARFAPPA